MASKGLIGSITDPIFEGLFGGDTSDEDAKAREYLEQSLAQYDNLTPPDLQDVQFDNYSWLGDFVPQNRVQAPTVDAGPDVQYAEVDPRLADLEKLSGTAYDQLQTDPRLREQQLQSLAALDEIAASGGLTTQDQANLNRIQTDAATADRGRREAILQNAQQRGMGGSGLELLAQLQSSQAATDRAAQQGLDVAGLAQQRALDAILQGSNVAGNLRGQDFSEQSRVADARDAIAKFNAQNTNQNNQYNVGVQNQFAAQNAANQFQAGLANRAAQTDTARFNAGNQFAANQANVQAANQAAQANQQGRQATANANVDTRNKARTINAGLPQQQFQNQLQVAQGKSGAAQAGQNYWQQQGDREAQEAANRMGAATQLGAAAITKSDKHDKTDVSQISDDEVNEFLNAVSPKKYRYKDPSAPGTAPGQRLGLLAQDVEGTRLGQDVVKQDENGTRYLDNENLLGAIVASLAHLNNKGK
jgi:hypothetical protein